MIDQHNKLYFDTAVYKKKIANRMKIQCILNSI